MEICLDEKAPGFLDKFMGSRPQVFLDILESVIYEVARKGEGVIIGHGSQMLLRNFDCAFHVRVFHPTTAHRQHGGPAGPEPGGADALQRAFPWK